MPLTWDVTKIENNDEVTTAYREENGEQVRIWSPVTETLVWRSMAIGMGSITEENIAEFYFRMRLYDELFEPSLYEPDGEGGIKYRSITRDELKAHIGLRCNVGPETRSAFVKRMMKHFEGENKFSKENRL